MTTTRIGTTIAAAAAALAAATVGFAATAQAGSYYHGHGYGFVVAVPAPGPVVVVAPERGPVYFKRDFAGTRLVFKQCYQQRALTAEGDPAWEEVCR